VNFIETKFSKSELLLFVIMSLVCTISTYFVSENIYFWDTVQLGSKHAHFFYELNFESFLLTDDIDSGHIPVFGAYIACCWKLFGKSLVVSHFAMLPFLIGIVYEAIVLMKKIISPSFIVLGVILFLLDPTLLAQSILISPDVVLVYFFLLGLNGILAQKKFWIAISVIGLLLISMRGAMVVSALFLFEITLLKPAGFKNFISALIKNSVPYVPGIFLFLMYHAYHYLYKDWIFYHENSPWAPAFEKAAFVEVIRNIVLLGWRIVDFGRIFVWATLFMIVYKNFKEIRFNKIFQLLIKLLFFSFFFLSYSFVAYKGLSGGRYLLPIYLIGSISVIYLIDILAMSKKKYFLLLSFGLLTGHFWTYPASISQSWDCSLAHLPYNSLLRDMRSYLSTNDIEIDEVSTGFPNLAQERYLYLNDSKLAFKSLDSINPEYILQSNVYNDLKSPEVKALLQRYYTPMQTISKYGVDMTLYKIK
jgi:hypothetical protein